MLISLLEKVFSLILNNNVNNNDIYESIVVCITFFRIY